MASWTDPATHTWAVGEQLTAAHLVTFLQQNTEFLYGDTTWTPVGAGLQNGWGDFGGGYAATGYRRIGTRVKLRGLMSGGTMNTIAFTLPVGYRPPSDALFAVASNGAFGDLHIASTGVVVPVVGSNVWVSLEGVEFDTLA